MAIVIANTIGLIVKIANSDSVKLCKIIESPMILAKNNYKYCKTTTRNDQVFTMLNRVSSWIKVSVGACLWSKIVCE